MKQKIVSIAIEPETENRWARLWAVTDAGRVYLLEDDNWIEVITPELPDPEVAK